MKYEFCERGDKNCVCYVVVCVHVVIDMRLECVVCVCIL